MLAAATLLLGASPAADERTAILTPVERWFAGIATADAALIRAQIASGEGGGATIVKVDATSVPSIRHLGWIELLAPVGRSTHRYAERFTGRPTVLADGDLAVVWGAYVFAIDGRPDHCGANHVELVREASGWKVRSFSWSQRAC